MTQRESIELFDSFRSVVLHDVDKGSKGLARGAWNRDALECRTPRATEGLNTDKGHVRIDRQEIVAWFEPRSGIMDWKWVGQVWRAEVPLEFGTLARRWRWRRWYYGLFSPRSTQLFQNKICKAEFTRPTILMPTEGVGCCVIIPMLDVGITSWAQDFASAFRRVASLE